MSYVDPTPRGAATGTRRFAVAWRNRVRRASYPVAVLDYEPAVGYRFQYLRAVTSATEGFRPFVGFPDLEATYEAERLWPFFDLRVMDRKRPDFEQYVRWLGLSPEANRLDLLSRSVGGQKGDNVSLTEAPRIGTDGWSESIFLLRGVAHAVKEFQTVAQARAVQSEDLLRLVDQPTNIANPDAMLVTTSEGDPLGWIPDLLIRFARRVRETHGELQLIQNNGPEAPWHVCLLMRLATRLPQGETYFADGIWPPVLTPVP